MSQKKKILLSLSNDRSVIGMIIFGRSIEWSGLNSKVGVRILGYLPGPLLFGKVSYGHMLLPVLWESLTDGWLQSSVFTTWVEVIAEYSFPLLKNSGFEVLFYWSYKGHTGCSVCFELGLISQFTSILLVSDICFPMLSRHICNMVLDKGPWEEQIIIILCKYFLFFFFFSPQDHQSFCSF